MSFFPRAHAVNDAALMVDIETLGTGTDAAVISIGAVLFEPRGNDTWDTMYERAFYRAIDIEDAAKYGQMDPGTIKWWFGQSDLAIKRLITGEAVTLRTALMDLIRYGRTRDSADPRITAWPVANIVWAKSPDFDCTILKSACGHFDITWPWPFYNARCVRTAQDLAYPDGDRPNTNVGTAHDAKDDAVAQALMIQACYRELNLTDKEQS